MIASYRRCFSSEIITLVIQARRKLYQDTKKLVIIFIFNFMWLVCEYLNVIKKYIPPGTIKNTYTHIANYCISANNQCVFISKSQYSTHIISLALLRPLYCKDSCNCFLPLLVSQIGICME